MKKIYQILSSNNIDKLFEEICNELIEINLFHKFIELCPIPDFEVEHLLKKLRKNLLLNANIIVNKKAHTFNHLIMCLIIKIFSYIYYTTKPQFVNLFVLEIGRYLVVLIHHLN